MNGDEDLGQDITMKGEKFHYNQNVQLEGEGDAKAEAVPPPEKVSILDPKIAKTHTTFYGQKWVSIFWIHVITECVFKNNFQERNITNL